MITEVTIERLRGIRHGELKGLSPLTVFVGRNGCGKTTVLDAIFMAASPNTNEAVVRAIRRRKELNNATRWLFWRTGDEGSATISLGLSSLETRRATLEPSKTNQVISWSILTGYDHISRPRGSGSIRYDLPSNKGGPRFIHREPEIGDVHLIEFQPNGHEPLHTLHTEALRVGRRKEVQQLIADLLPGGEDIQILTEGDEPVVHLVFPTGTVPVALAGDGVLSLAILAWELAARAGGVVMLEEPEVYQHPAALRQTAKAIVAAVRRGVQVILSTHSLDLIDHLLDQSKPDDLEKLAVFRLALDQGELKSTRIPGTDVAFARSQIGDDLR